MINGHRYDFTDNLDWRKARCWTQKQSAVFSTLHVSIFLRVFVLQAVEKLVQVADSGCSTEKQWQTVLNCTRLLTRILPYIFEDADWRGFFWSTVPGAGRARVWPATLTPLGAGGLDLGVVVRTRRGLLVLWLPAPQQNLHPNTGHIVLGLNVL